MSILQRTVVGSVEEPAGESGTIGSAVAVVVAAVSGSVALITGVLGVIALGH